MATVLVPTPLRRLTKGQSKVDAPGDNIAAVFRSVNDQYPGFDEKLMDDEGNVKRFINVFLNNDEIRSLQGMDTPVADDDKVSFVPAMAGGQETQLG